MTDNLTHLNLPISDESRRLRDRVSTYFSSSRTERKVLKVSMTQSFNAADNCAANTNFADVYLVTSAILEQSRTPQRRRSLGRMQCHNQTPGRPGLIMQFSSLAQISSCFRISIRKNLRNFQTVFNWDRELRLSRSSPSFSNFRRK